MSQGVLDPLFPRAGFWLVRLRWTLQMRSDLRFLTITCRYERVVLRTLPMFGTKKVNTRSVGRLVWSDKITSLSLWFVVSGFELLWYGMVQCTSKGNMGGIWTRKTLSCPSAIGKIPHSPASKQIALISMMRLLARL